MGLGMQLLAWHEDFVASLVARGFRVIRFDNRDIGLSQGFDRRARPTSPSLPCAHARPAGQSAYRLADMAADSAPCSTSSASQSAHVCGASMGGMIAQHWPHAIRSG